MADTLKQTTTRLREYFATQPAVELAFLFGSRSREQQSESSDWDIGIYFTPGEFAELESSSEYEDGSNIWADLTDLLQSDAIDVVVLNRAAPKIVYAALRDGIELKNTDSKLYFRLLNKASYEAMDYWKTVSQYRHIFERAQSLTPEAKSELEHLLVFLQSQLDDLPQFASCTVNEYSSNRNTQRNIERLVENIVMASLDISKVVLASEKRSIPQTYKEIIETFVRTHGDESVAEQFGSFVELRNIVAHEYLDIRWKRIKRFIDEGATRYDTFAAWARRYIEQNQ